MMHMTFYWGHKVTLLIDSWKTDSWFSYFITLIVCFLFPVLYQFLEVHRLQLKLLSSSANGVTGAIENEPLLYTKFFSSRKRKRLGGSVLFK